MRVLACSLFLASCCAMCAGCGAARIRELTAKVAQLEAQTKKLESENARLQTELADAKRKLDEVEAIRKGYESARAALKKAMDQLGPLVGAAGSPLPPFEGLKDSSWVGKLGPPAETASGLKQLQDTFKELMGPPGAKPKR